jgi:hypothetical protein
VRVDAGAFDVFEDVMNVPRLIVGDGNSAVKALGDQVRGPRQSGTSPCNQFPAAPLGCWRRHRSRRCDRRAQASHGPSRRGWRRRFPSGARWACRSVRSCRRRCGGWRAPGR